MIRCRSCESSKLISAISLGDIRLSDFINTNQKVKSFPLNSVLCTKCTLLQLEKTTPLKYLYTERYGYRSGVNESMRNSLKEIVFETKKKAHLGSNDIVLDIGCNDKTLLSFYSNKLIKTGFDPVRKFSKYFSGDKEIFVNDYFNYKKFKELFGSKKAKAITAISMFYDLDKPNNFLRDIAKTLDSNGVFVIQQNYLSEMIKTNSIDNIVHEHVCYYSLKSLEYLLSGHNLEVFDVKLDSTNGGSFRTFIGFKGKRKISKSVINLRRKEGKEDLDKISTYKRFSKEVGKTLLALRSFIIDQSKKGKVIYVYGASTRGNTLIQCAKLNNVLIKKAVDRNPEKWGKNFGSSGISIISEAAAHKEKPDYLLILPWFFKDEFIKRESVYLKNGGHFIFPLPKFKIV